jgi:hypothetical protein
MSENPYQPPQAAIDAGALPGWNPRYLHWLMRGHVALVIVIATVGGMTNSRLYHVINEESWFFPFTVVSAILAAVLPFVIVAFIIQTKTNWRERFKFLLAEGIVQFVHLWAVYELVTALPVR